MGTPWFSRHLPSRWILLLAAAGCWFCSESPRAAERSAESARQGLVIPDARQQLDQQQLSDAIDVYFANHWRTHGIEPAPAADDAEFLRRTYLDLVGKIPPVSEVRAFLNDSSDGKRARVIDSLLQQGACANHFANVWRAILLGGAADDFATRALAPRLETWLKLRFTANMPYDQLVRELLLAPLRNADRMQFQVQADGIPDPSAYYQAAERKPELLAAGSSRVFLGLQVQCAQCHDHPHAHWTRQEFWSYAALFTDLGDMQAPEKQIATNETNSAAEPIGLKIPDTEIFASAAFLDGTNSGVSSNRSRRVALVRWLTGPDNRWFASAVTNRMFEQLLGRGLIDPVDDLEAAGANDHPELLAFVAEQFRSHNYDLRYLLRAISGTRLYQFSSSTGSGKPIERHHFARMPLRRMTAEQLFDSLVQATGLNEPQATNVNFFNDVDTLRGEFRQKFSDANIAQTEAETSILQALSLMNGKLVVNAVDLTQGQTLAAINDAPFMDTKSKIETLFLATFGRPPVADESRQFVEYVEAGGPKKDSAAALADVCWALLNSAEFVVVH